MALQIGQIFIGLDAKIDSFKRNIEIADAKLQGLNDVLQRNAAFFKTAGIAMTTFAGFLSAGFNRAFKAAIEYGLELDKLHKTTGISVEDLARLGYAAEQEHTSMETIRSAVSRLSANLFDASMGMGMAVRALEELGISAATSEGRLKTVYEIILEVSDKVKYMTDKTKATAIAMDLFGRAGKEMIPLLSLGSKTIKELGEEAEALGIVISEKSAKALKYFDDIMTLVKRGIEGLKFTLALHILPELQKFIDRVKNLILAFHRLSESQKKTIMTFAVMAVKISAIVGPLMIIIGLLPKFIALWGTLTKVIPMVGKFLAGIHPLIGVIGALAVGIAILSRKISEKAEAQKRANIINANSILLENLAVQAIKARERGEEDLAKRIEDRMKRLKERWKKEEEIAKKEKKLQEGLKEDFIERQEEERALLEARRDYELELAEDRKRLQLKFIEEDLARVRKHTAEWYKLMKERLILLKEIRAEEEADKIAKEEKEKERELSRIAEKERLLEEELAMLKAKEQELTLAIQEENRIRIEHWLSMRDEILFAWEDMIARFIEKGGEFKDYLATLTADLWGIFSRYIAKSVKAFLFGERTKQGEIIKTGLLTLAWEKIKSIGHAVTSAFKAIPFPANIAAAAAAMAAVVALFTKIKGMVELAEGAIVTKPTIAMVGEAGREAVIPLDKGEKFLKRVVNINITGNNILNDEMVDNICNKIQFKLAMMGV